MGWRSTAVLIGLVIVVGSYLWLADGPSVPADRDRSRPGDRPNAESTMQALRTLLAFEPADRG